MMLNGRGGGRMTVGELSRQMFENCLKDCGLDLLFWALCRVGAYVYHCILF